MAVKFPLTLLDKNGSDVTVKYSAKLGGTPAVSFFMRQYADMIDVGHALPVLVATNAQHSVIWVEEQGQVIAASVYGFLEDDDRTTWVLFSGVAREARGRGLYRILHQLLEETARAAGSRKIASHIHVNNTTALHSNARLGKNPEFFKVEKKLL